MTTTTGTPYYCCPEVWQGKSYGFKSDIWSLGVIIYEMAALEPPFKATDIPNLFSKVLKGKYQRIPKQYSNDLAKVIDSWLQLKPCNRPLASMLVKEKIVMRHIDDSEEIKDQLEVPTQKLLDTIQPSVNVNILRNRLPQPKYKIKSWNDISAIKLKHKLQSIDSIDSRTTSSDKHLDKTPHKVDLVETPLKKPTEVKSKFIRKPVCHPITAHCSGSGRPPLCASKSKTSVKKWKRGTSKSKTDSVACVIF